MNYLAEQSYYKIERELSGTEQLIITHERTMYLYDNKVVTKHHEFPIQDVYDISYRRLGGSEGLLYLHTKVGVYSYLLRSDPGLFIEVYRKINKRL